LWLRALFTGRTEDWDFIKTARFPFLEELPYVQAAGGETGLRVWVGCGRSQSSKNPEWARGRYIVER